MRPEDLSRDATLELLLPRADGQLSSPLPMTGLADGTFSVAFAPEAAAPGPAYVHVRTAGTEFYAVTTATTLDFGDDFQGRPDVQPATAGTSIRVSFDGLTPFVAADEVVLVSSGAAAQWSTSKQAGGTSADVVFDGTKQNLVDATKGDVVLALQNHYTDLSTYGTRVLTTFGTLPPFTQVAGSTTQVPATGRFTMRTLQPAEMTTVSVQWRRSEFQKLRTDIHPQAIAGEQFAGLFAEPNGGVTYGEAVVQLALVTAQSEATDVVTAPLSYANPLPASWGPLAFANSLFTVSFMAPGATKPDDAPAFLEVYESASPAPKTYDARPFVSPARNIRIDGASAATATSVAASPNVEWDAPSVGPASMYVLEVVRADNDAGQTTLRTVTSIYTAEPHARIPGGVMVPGPSYLLRVISVRDARKDPTASPFRLALPFGRARAYTSLFTVNAK
jgi:hypothetical protein